MNIKKTAKSYFNPDGEELLEEKISSGNPSGFIDFNRSKFAWASNIYQQMLNLTWFPKQVNCSNEQKQFQLLTENEQNIYKYVFAQLSFNDCLIEGTEILTSKGFKDFKDLTYEDKVANFHHNREISFSIPKKIINEQIIGNKMIRISGNNYEQIVTPNHKLIYYQNNYKIKKQYAESFKAPKPLPIAGIANSKNKIKTLSLIDKLMLHLLFIDGGISINKNEISKISNILRESNVKFKIISKQYLNKNSKTILYIDKQNMELSIFKLLKIDITTLSLNYIEDIFNEISSIFKYKQNTKRLSLQITNNTILNELQILALLSKRVTYKQDNKIIIDKVSVVKKNMKVEEIEYNGRVYCVTVNTGMIICRYNGNVFITGNSAQTKYLSDIQQKTNNHIVKACLIRQSWEECLTQGHSVLKDNGEWIDISKVKVGDKILTHTTDRKMFFDTVSHTVKYDYDGELYHFKHKKFSQITTAEHRIPYIDRNGNLKIKRAKNFKDGKVGLDLITDSFNTIQNVQLTRKPAQTNTKVYCVTVNSGMFVVKHNNIISVTGNCNHCYIDGTKVLTSKGFIDFKDLTFEDKVANYNEDGTISFSKPTDIIKSRYRGIMYDFHRKNYRQIVTPNHRVVTRYSMYSKFNKDKQNQINIQFAEDIDLSNLNMPIAGYGIGSKIELSAIERIAIAFQANGCYMNKQWCINHNYNYKDYKNKNGYSYCFNFKRADKISRMEKLLKEADINYTQTTNKRGYTNFYINTDFKMDKEFSWVNLEELSGDYCLQFIDELKYWDGSKRSNKSVLYTNSNRKAIDKVVEIAALGGSQIEVYYVNPEISKGYNLIDSWQIHIVPNKVNKSGKNIKKDIIDYDGMVYCCTVKSGMLVCKYDESVFISGNSDSYAVLLDKCGNSNEVFDLYKTDDMLREKNEAISAQFARYINGDTTKDLLYSSMASINLEGIYFLLGFGYIFTLGDKVQGARDMIVEIAKDEILSHISLFANIYKQIRRENNFNIKEITDVSHKMLDEAVMIELKYGLYLLKQFPILGLTEEDMINTIYNYANERCVAIGIEPIYNKSPETQLQKLIQKNVKQKNIIKTNPFEGNVKNYAKGHIDLNDF